MLKFFNSEAISSIPPRIKVSPAGFRYAFVENVFQEPVYKELVRGYPPFGMFTYHEDAFKKVYEGPYYDSHDHHGCAHHLKNLSAVWKEVLREAMSEEFVTAFSQASGVPFNSLRNFSFKYGKEGCEIKPHLDQASLGKKGQSRLVSMWYFAGNAAGGPGGTCIYDTDRQTILAEARHLYNSMVFFEQHPVAWHGYKPMPAGADRYAMAITFNEENRTLGLNDSLWHNLFCLRRFATKPKIAPASKLAQRLGNLAK